MCGIFGQYAPGGANREAVERMAARLHHRGPDGYATYVNGAIGFGTTRLSIIDLAAAPPPIFNEDGSAAVVFNGEIYNFQALRRELEAQGHRFSTHTDTEVIVHGYEAWGLNVVDHLRGMFALGIWDEHAGRLMLARDRLGKKPLYYAPWQGGLVFASEIKALLAGFDLPRAVSREALMRYLLLGYTPAPHTMFEGIYKLHPGEMLVVDATGSTSRRFWTPAMEYRDDVPTFAGAARQVREMLIEAVRLRMVSDVPVGAFLSGGVDSSAVVAIMSQFSREPVKTFTVGFDFPPGSENDVKFNVDTRHARRVAAMLGTDHHTITLKEAFPLGDLLPHLVNAMDEPVAQPAVIQTVFVAALARHRGIPVLLSGDGADEAFAGYPFYQAEGTLERYLRLPEALRRLVADPLLRRLPFEQTRKLAGKASLSSPVERYLAWWRLIEAGSLPRLLQDDALARGALAALGETLLPRLEAPRTPHFADRVGYANLSLWLAEDSNMRMDKMSMLMSVETRAPFEDHELMTLALSLPLAYKLRGGRLKAVLKQAVAGMVPHEVLTRPKWGFFQPSSRWLRTLLRPTVEHYLGRERLEASGVFKPEAAAALVDGHLNRGEYHLHVVWSMLVFQIWHALYIEQSVTLDEAPTAADLVGMATISEGV